MVKNLGPLLVIIGAVLATIGLALGARVYRWELLTWAWAAAAIAALRWFDTRGAK